MGVTTSTANAGATYVPLATQTPGSAVSSVTFSSIPSGYTDLVLVCNFTAGATNFSTRVNGDTGTNYSYTRLYGTGSSAASSNSSNDNVGITSNISNSSSNPTQMIVQFQNYSNTTTNKTALMRFGDASAIVFAVVGLWRNTAAITSLTVYSTSAQTIPAGSTFTLFGVKNA